MLIALCITDNQAVAGVLGGAVDPGEGGFGGAADHERRCGAGRRYLPAGPALALLSGLFFVNDVHELVG